MGKYKYLEIMIEYVFRANFNDSYYLETVCLDLNDLIKDEPVWIDPYHGRSKINNTRIAIRCFSDEEFILLEKQGEKIKEYQHTTDFSFICTEDFDASVFLAAHITFRRERNKVF